MGLSHPDEKLSFCGELLEQLLGSDDAARLAAASSIVYLLGCARWMQHLTFQALWKVGLQSKRNESVEVRVFKTSCTVALEADALGLPFASFPDRHTQITNQRAADGLRGNAFKKNTKAQRLVMSTLH
jgi:hypothetical protein